MRLTTVFLALAALAVPGQPLLAQEKERHTGGIWSGADGRVVQVLLPRGEDVAVIYGSRNPVFNATLRTKSAEIEAVDLFIGDGVVAVRMYAHPSKGVFLQDDEIKSGTTLKNGSTFTMKKGYKEAKDLKPGDIYVILPGVKFEKPKE